jgi:surface polysaccharide O-acyltransferase-like enzyme
MKQPKLSWANDLRALATIAVIVLHVSSTIMPAYPGISKSYFFSAVLINAAMRWCVPVFIMLSGSFALEQYDGRLWNFLTKMFFRIVLPFLAWSIVYLFFFSWPVMADPNQTAGDRFSFIGKQLLSGTASHMWFVYTIVSLYLLFPILSKFTKTATEKEYIYFLSIWAALLILNPYLEKYENGFDFAYFSGYLGYIVLGNYLFKTERKINRFVLLTIFIAAFLYTGLRSYFALLKVNDDTEGAMENLTVNVMLMSAAVYLLFKNYRSTASPFLRKIIDGICDNSSGIYLSHLLILNLFIRAGLLFSFVQPVLAIPVISLASLLISCTLIIWMKKIPLLKSLAG